MGLKLKMLAAAFTASFLLQRTAGSHPLRFISTGVLLFLAEFLLYNIWSVLIYPRCFSPIRHVPEAPDGNFFLGQTRKIMAASSGKPMREWIENTPNDGLIRYSMWGTPRLLPTNPKTLGEVLVQKNYDFVKPPLIRRSLGRLLGVGILLAEGDEHKRQRKSLMPAFAFRHVKDLYPVFWSKSREMVECLSKASDPKTSKPVEVEKNEGKATSEKVQHAPGIIEVDSWASRATLDIIGLAGMDQDFNALQDSDNKLNQTYRTVFRPNKMARIMGLLGVFLPFWFLSRLPIKHNSNIEGASATIKQTCRDLIANKRKRMAEKEKTGVDIISVALESGGFSDEDLANQMMTFLAAGHETTATAMIWALYSLCRNPSIQTKLRAEIHAKLPPPDQPITAAQIDDCAYLHAVCSEVLRLHSPVTATLRTAACDTTIGNHFVPKGTLVMLSPYAVNTSTALWGADAHDFRPERWLDADGTANNKGGADSNFAFLTFLHGPRSCIGQRFAQAEFACLLAAWVGRFETEFEEGSPLREGEPDIGEGITGKPRGGVWVKLREVGGW